MTFQRNRPILLWNILKDLLPGLFKTPLLWGRGGGGDLLEYKDN